MVAQSLSVRTPEGLTALRAVSGDAVPGWRVLLNLLGYQVGWLLTVYGATHGQPWLGPIMAVLIVGLHLLLVAHPLRSVVLIALVTAVGFLLENGLLYAGWVAYPHSPFTVPIWMLALWPMFATTLSVSLRWFQRHLALATLLGAVFGPLAYWGGAMAGAIVLPDAQSALILLGVVWIVSFPLLLVLARQLEKH